MFTGIIEATGEVLRKTDDSLVVARPAFFDDLKKGSSVAVAGACLTVVDLDAKGMTFNVVAETWKKTKLGKIEVGDRVNLERALKADGRLDGHMVQGHVEDVAVISSIPRPLPPKEEGGSLRKGPTRPNILFFAREMRKNPTGSEEMLWQFIRNDQLGVRFRRQYPLGGRIMDFYCPALKLGIELDGKAHVTQAGKTDDKIRDTYLREEHGARILRFMNKELIENPAKVLEVIQAAVSPSPPERGLGGEATLKFKSPAHLLKFIIPKGSITLDGVSLTVANIEDDIVTVALIPETLQTTTLGSLKPGDQINIETDILGRYVHSLLRHT